MSFIRYDEFLNETEDFYSFSNKVGFNMTDYVRDAENVCGGHKCFAQLLRYHRMPSFWCPSGLYFPTANTRSIE